MIDLVDFIVDCCYCCVATIILVELMLTLLLQLLLLLFYFHRCLFGWSYWFWCTYGNGVTYRRCYWHRFHCVCVATATVVANVLVVVDDVIFLEVICCIVTAMSLYCAFLLRKLFCAHPTARTVLDIIYIVYGFSLFHMFAYTKIVLLCCLYLKLCLPGLFCFIFLIIYIYLW